MFHMEKHSRNTLIIIIIIINSDNSQTVYFGPRLEISAPVGWALDTNN